MPEVSKLWSAKLEKVGRETEQDIQKNNGWKAEM
jgi:hypothetical protein